MREPNVGQLKARDRSAFAIAGFPRALPRSLRRMGAKKTLSRIWEAAEVGEALSPSSPSITVKQERRM